MKIIEVNHSIANRFDNYIEINKHLRDYPNLLEPILKHELQHTDKAWSVKDFKLDFLSNNEVNQLDLLKFMIKHPSSFVQISPILYSRKKGFIVDINLLIMYLIFGVLIISTIYVGVKYL